LNLANHRVHGKHHLFKVGRKWNSLLDDKSIITVFQGVFRSVAKLEVAFVALTLITLILGAGILVPVYSIVVGILNFAINVIPVISGIILVLFCVIFFAIVGFLGSLLVRF